MYLQGHASVHSIKSEGTCVNNVSRKETPRFLLCSASNKESNRFVRDALFHREQAIDSNENNHGLRIFGAGELSFAKQASVFSDTSQSLPLGRGSSMSFPAPGE